MALNYSTMLTDSGGGSKDIWKKQGLTAPEKSNDVIKPRAAKKPADAQNPADKITPQGGGGGKVSGSYSRRSSAAPSGSASPAVASQLYGVDADTLAKMNKAYQQSPQVTAAYERTQQLLEQMQGPTPYADQIKDMMDQIQNRDPFAWDPNTDTLFQKALSSSMYKGRQAMQDTMGQAAALTGGYGSTYATAAANGAYNDYIQQAYDDLPQYYQMALNEWEAEGEDMYRRLGMLQDADDTYFNRLSANYGAQSDYANNMYSREYGEWGDSVEQARAYAEMLNSNYWQNANFQEQQRQFNAQLAEEQRQFNAQMAQRAAAARQSDKASDKTSDKASRGKLLTPSELRAATAAYNKGGDEGLAAYLDSHPEISDEGLQIVYTYVSEHGHYQKYSQAEINKIKRSIGSNGVGPTATMLKIPHTDVLAIARGEEL